MDKYEYADALGKQLHDAKNEIVLLRRLLREGLALSMGAGSYADKHKWEIAVNKLVGPVNA